MFTFRCPGIGYEVALARCLGAAWQGEGEEAIFLSRPREGLDIAERLTVWRESLAEDVP